MTILMSTCGHVVTAGIYTYLLLLPFLYSLGHQQAAQLFMGLVLVKQPKPSFLKGLDY